MSVSLSSWISTIGHAVDTRDSALLSSAFSARVDDEFVASFSGDVATKGGVANVAAALPFEAGLKKVAGLCVAFLCGAEKEMHANYLALFVAFEGYMCEDFHIQVLRSLCADLVLLAFLDPDPKITLTNAVKTLDAFPRLKSLPDILKMQHSAGPRGFSFFIPINASFKVCFKLNELTRCPKIIEQVDLVLRSMSFSDFQTQDVVTFNFYLGRLKLIHHEFNLADKALSLAYNLCPPHYYNQKRHILLYLTVARLVLGAHPSPHLLEEYSLSHIFMPLIQALLSGNLAQYEYIVSSMQPFLMLHKCFGILRYRTRVTLFRNLVKRVWMIQNQPRTLSFHEVCVAARVSGFGSEFSVEDAECLVQSLVDQGFLLGYLNHGKRCVVLRGEVFPTMYSLK